MINQDFDLQLKEVNNELKECIKKLRDRSEENKRKEQEQEQEQLNLHEAQKENNSSTVLPSLSATENTYERSRYNSPFFKQDEHKNFEEDKTNEDGFLRSLNPNS